MGPSRREGHGSWPVQHVSWPSESDDTRHRSALLGPTGLGFSDVTLITRGGLRPRHFDGTMLLGYTYPWILKVEVGTNRHDVGRTSLDVRPLGGFGVY